MDSCTHAVGYGEELFGEVRGAQRDDLVLPVIKRMPGDCGWGGGCVCKGGWGGVVAVGVWWYVLDFGWWYYAFVSRYSTGVV